MDSLEDIKKLKQEFLKNEILNKGYDPKHFSEYISDKKKDGTDIDNWILVELEKIVVDYKAEPEVFFSKDLIARK